MQSATAAMDTPHSSPAAASLSEPSAPARATLLTPLRGLRAAVVFLTRVPAGGFPYSEVEWRWACAFFPLVGAAVGALSAGVARLTSSAGPAVAAALALIASLLVTGALHEDGLADTADALGGSYDRDKLFVILKDSRIGAFGAIALVMSLMLRAALLTRLDDHLPAALLLAGAWSRLAPVWLMRALPYVTATVVSRSRPLVQARLPQTALAMVWGLAAVFVAARLGLTPLAVVSAVGATLIVTLLCGWRFWIRAGGITGDFLGATQQIVECAVLLVLAVTTTR